MRRCPLVLLALLAVAVTACGQLFEFPPRSPVPCHTDCEPTPGEQNDTLMVWNP